MSDGTMPTQGERPHRRPGWTEGLPLTLADGSAWYGPRIGPALLITDGALLADLREAVVLALGVQAQASRGRRMPLLSLHFEAAMRRIAVRLLRVNYDLPEAAWATLVHPETTGGATAVPAWVRRSLQPVARIAGQLAGPNHLGRPVDPSLN